MKNNFIRCAKAAGKVAMAAVALLTFAQCSGKEGEKVNDTTVEVCFADSVCRVFDFYGDDIVRVFQDPQGGEMRDPVATPEAQILVDNPRRAVTSLTVKEKGTKVEMTTPRIKVVVDKATQLMTVTDCGTGVHVALTAEHRDDRAPVESLEAEVARAVLETLIPKVDVCMSECGCIDHIGLTLYRTAV